MNNDDSISISDFYTRLMFLLLLNVNYYYNIIFVILCDELHRGCRHRRTWPDAQWNVLSGREYNIKYVHNQLITLPQCENPAKTLAAMMIEN
jgi:hypothetical protein